MKNFIVSIIITFFGGYIVMLFHTNKLNFYIHPRYITFTYLAGLTLLCVGVFSLQIVLSKPELRKLLTIKNTREALRDPVTIGLLVLPLILGFALPVKALSAFTTSQRILDLNSVRSGILKVNGDFTAESSSFTLGDWVSALNSNPQRDRFLEKEVNVSGFIYSPESTDDTNYFLLSRFSITCCAVDATPVGLYVYLEDWQQKYSENDWLEIEGNFELKELAGKEELVIVAGSVSEINTPDNPYIY